MRICLSQAGLMLPAGALGDRYGRKRLLLIGLAVFGAGSLAAAFGGNAVWLIVARAAMGLGAAIILPMVFAVLTVVFPERERGRAVSFVVIGVSAGLPLGPILGGYLLDRFWWGTIFLINLPIVVATAIAVGVLLPESRALRPGRADLDGGVLSTIGLAAFIYGIVQGPARSWPVLAVAVVVLTGFVIWELRTDEPMIDLRLFTRAQFAWGTAAAALSSLALYGLLFTLPQYLRFVAGVDGLGMGLRLLPPVAGILVGAPLGAWLAARFAYRVPVSGGLLLAGAGFAVGATTGVSSGYAFVAAWLTIAGLGIGMAMTPALDAVLAVLPAGRSGSGTALTQALRQVSGALEVALMASLLSHGFTDRVATAGLPGEAARAARESIAAALSVAARFGDPLLAASARAAFMHGIAVALTLWAVVALAGAALTAAYLPGRAGKQ